MRYADRYGREVIVELDFATASHFRDDFSFYFTSHDANLILTSAGVRADFDQLQTFPPEFKGRISSYRAQFSTSVMASVDVETGRIPNFDFSRDYSEPLLLSHASGGGIRKAEIALRRLSLSEELRCEVQNRLARIGGSYTSIHIRNTDFTTDYQMRVEALAGKISGPIYVATDNQEALQFCKTLFGNTRAFNFSTLPDDGGKPMHSNALLDARQSNFDAICDLILLASATTYYFFPLSNPQLTGATYSGFSRLAELLHKDKALLRQFVDSREFGSFARLRLRGRKMLYRCFGLASALMPAKRRSH